jgi:hypothetical protein
MLSSDQMHSQVEQITDGSMSTQKSLRLLQRLEPPHPSLPHPGRLMGLLGPVILILLGTVDRLRKQFPVSDSIAPQLISHDLPRLTAMRPQEPHEEPLRCRTITLRL